MSKLHVLLKKEELEAQRLPDKVVVVLDVLFATTTIVTALAHGASEVVPTLDRDAALSEAARQTVFGRLVASGWQTCALAMRMMCDAYLLDSASAGSPGVENIRWIAPVRPGDTLRVRLSVLEARVLRTKPHIGLVRNKWEMFNQENEQVMHMEGYGMFLRRDHPE